MRTPHSVSVGVAILALGIACLSVEVGGRQKAAGTRLRQESTNWVTPRTAWGDPDLQGVWSNTTATPLQRPDNLAGKTVLTDEERLRLDAQATRNADRPPRPGSVGAYNTFWLERGTFSSATSLIVDPPDGRLPPLTPEAQHRLETLKVARQRHPTAVEDFHLFERCITRGMPGAMMPGFYNHNYHILQIPGYVVMLLEMIHDVRIVPLDGRPHVGSSIRQWLGDSRGRWEGNTLVVQTTNFVDKVHDMEGLPGMRDPLPTVFGTGEKMRLEERFTRIGPDAIDYRFTVNDPATFTRPWTAAAPMSRTDDRIFEYACHEGNRAMVNSLNGNAR
jgi:hypothetical protein